jgi:hypothetical protein
MSRKQIFKSKYSIAFQKIQLLSSSKRVDGRTIKKLQNELDGIIQLPKFDRFIQLLDSLINIKNVAKINPVEIVKRNKIIKQIYNENKKVKVKSAPVIQPPIIEQSVEYKFKTRDEAYKQMSKLYRLNKPIYGTINMVIYGRKTLAYYPDYTFTKFLSSHDLNDSPIMSRVQLVANKGQGNNSNKSSPKGLMYHELNKLLGTDEEIVTGQFFIISEEHGIKYQHHLRNGAFNCVLDCIKQQKTSFKLKDDNDKKILDVKKINELNEKYLINGISFDDLKDISYKMICVIQIYSKLNELLYSTHTEDEQAKSKRQIIKCTLENLDHVEIYKILQSKSNKQIVYVKYIDDRTEEEIEKDNETDDNEKALSQIKRVQEHFNKSFFQNQSNYLLCKKDNFNNISYYWNEETIFKMAHTENFDLGKYFINNNYDLLSHKMDEFNELENNYISKIDDETLFSFVNDSIHHPNEIYFNENIHEQFINRTIKDNGLDFGIDEVDDEYTNDEDKELIKYTSESIGKVDLSKYIAYDRNKHYSHFDKNEYYLKHGIPSTGKFNFYKVVEKLNADDIKILLSKVGFVQIDNIQSDNKIINNLGYFNNKYVYSIPMIDFLIKNNVKFDIIAIAINNWKQELILNQDHKTNKSFYTKFIGVMSINNDYKQYCIKCSSKTEFLDMKASNTNNKIKLSYVEQMNLIGINELNENIRNRGHIASYLLSYAMLEMLDKLMKVDYNDIIGIKTDCIILKKSYDNLFTISNLGGDYKYENKKFKDLRCCYDFINIKVNNDYHISNNLTFDKLRYNKISMIYAGAGCGKTSRFYKNFDNQDERINGAFSFPSNILTSKFKNEGFDIKASTYHKFFNIQSFDRANQSSKFINGFVDEVTMISDIDMSKIVKYAYQNKINLFLIGDYNPETKTSYQLKPPLGKSFLEYNFIESDIYKLNLTTNYRQGTDKEFTTFLNKSRGKSNNYVSTMAENSKMFKYIEYDELITNFTNNDLIISPFNKGTEKTNNDAKMTTINELIYKSSDVVNCRFNKATTFNENYYVNGELIQMTKTEYEKLSETYKNKINLAYCQTSHTVQGLEYNKDKTIYIINDRYFTDNQLYVIMSRAKESKQIVFVNL